MLTVKRDSARIGMLPYCQTNLLITPLQCLLLQTNKYKGSAIAGFARAVRMRLISAPAFRRDAGLHNQWRFPCGFRGTAKQAHLHIAGAKTALTAGSPVSSTNRADNSADKRCIGMIRRFGLYRTGA
jgi:hypothetical protein